MKWSEIKHSLRLYRNLFGKRSNQRKSAAPTDKPAVRFSFCKRNKHKKTERKRKLREDCRKRLAKEAAKTTESTGPTEKTANKKAKIGSIIDQQIKNKLKEFDAYDCSNSQAVEFIVDSECTSHAVKKRDMSFHYAPSNENGLRVQMAGNSDIPITGTGTVSLKTVPFKSAESVILILHNTNHIPQLSGNYFSVSAAADSGIICVFDEDSVSLYSALDSEVIAVGPSRDNIYYINGTAIRNIKSLRLNALRMTSKASPESLWHA